jgi:hypothetical protein
MIDDADIFYKFVTFKLNQKKCEIFRTSSKTHQITKIANEEKQYVSDFKYIKYLNVP